MVIDIDAGVFVGILVYPRPYPIRESQIYSENPKSTRAHASTSYYCILSTYDWFVLRTTNWFIIDAAELSICIPPTGI